MDELLIIPGAPKSGTTALFDALASASHSCTRSLIKEPSYLASGAKTGFMAKRQILRFADYERVLLRVSGCAVDASQSYFTEPLNKKHLVELREKFARINLIFVLREPYARISSAYRMDLSNGWVSRPLDFYIQRELNGLRNEYGGGPRYIEESLYYKNITRLLEILQPHQAHILVSSELSDVNRVVDVMSSIGVDIKLDAVLNKNASSSLVPPRWLAGLKEKAPLGIRRALSSSRAKTLLKSLVYERAEAKAFQERPPRLEMIESDKRSLANLLTADQRRMINI